MKSGELNKITDVAGVRVGHCTLADGAIQTGVTVIMPTPDNPFVKKLQAAKYVINGFGKTTGLMQVDELGQLESPIVLTNTLSVGRVQDGLVGYMIDWCQRDGHNLESINVVVGECNDSKINNITKRVINAQHVEVAIADAKADFALGSVGAGRGMVCYGIKGGIGSASRLVEVAQKTYTIGVLVLANHGKINQLVIHGQKIADNLKDESISKKLDDVEKGSIVVVIATDAPVDARQLKRISKRATAGIARTGSEFGNGSGDVVIAFSTANRIPHSFNKDDSQKLHTYQFMLDSVIDPLFSATANAVENAIISALENAETVGSVKCLAQHGELRF